MIRIYGIRDKLDTIKAQLSDVINQCMAEALAFPGNKRAHRFFPMDAEDFYYPEGRSDAYTVIEISMMEGRSDDARKKLIHLLLSVLKRSSTSCRSTSKSRLPSSQPVTGDFVV
jgi:hypothetical protein